MVMTQQNPKDTLQTDLEALAKVFEAEEREDRRKEAQRRRDGLPSPSGTSGPLKASRTVERLPATEVGLRDR